MFKLLKLILLGYYYSAIELAEYCRSLIRYRHMPKYLKYELLLLWKYLLVNPYNSCKIYLQRLGFTEQPYGETPLPLMEKILNKFPLSNRDVLLDLGCGRGKLCFWVACRCPCQVIGMDINSTFINKAKSIARQLELVNLTFIEQDIFSDNLPASTHIYLYGSAYADDVLLKLAVTLAKRPTFTTIFSVSFSLNDYCETPRFETVAVLSARFLWGETEVYIQKPLTDRTLGTCMK
jgi:SAM-dependent methyltransferase